MYYARDRLVLYRYVLLKRYSEVEITNRYIDWEEKDYGIING